MNKLKTLKKGFSLMEVIVGVVLFSIYMSILTAGAMSLITRERVTEKHIMTIMSQIKVTVEEQAFNEE